MEPTICDGMSTVKIPLKFQRISTKKEIFPVIHKVGNVDIFVQLLLEISCKTVMDQPISKQI